MLRTHTGWTSFVKVAGLVAVVLAAAVPVLAQSGAPESLRTKAEAMRKHLEKKGYVVREGLYSAVNLAQLYCEGAIDSCNGNNFGAVYHGYMVPELEGQAPTGLPYYFRLRRDEAVVVVGPTPPKCTFYSYAIFLFDRYDPVQNRVRKIASTMGQPLNRYLMNTGGKPFDTNVVLTITPEQRTDQAVRDAAKAAGFSPDVLNTYVIPSSILHTNDSLDATSDVLTITQREAMVTGPENPQKPIIFRVTPATPTPESQLKPLPAPELRVRGTGKTEMDYTPAVQQLHDAIVASHPGPPPQEYTTIQTIEQSPISIQTWANTLGDTSDAAYLGTQENFKLSNDPQDFLVVYGVDHTKTGKALYTAVTVYTSCKYCGVASVFDNQLGTTGSPYLARLPAPDASKLYAFKIARDCGGDTNCLTVPTGPCGQGAALDDDLFVTMRAYLETKTKTGPSYTELLFDRVMHFSAAPPQVPEMNTTFTGSYPGPVPVVLHATSSAGGPMQWKAAFESMDEPCCGALAPVQGVVDHGGSFSFSFTPNRPGTFYVEVTVADEQGRQTCGDVKIVSASP